MLRIEVNTLYFISTYVRRAIICANVTFINHNIIQFAGSVPKQRVAGLPARLHDWAAYQSTLGWTHEHWFMHAFGIL